MESYTSYPKVYAIGHRNIRDIFKEPVLIQEKVDGSQISFGNFLTRDVAEPILKIRSKGADLNIDYPEKMFSAAVAFIKSIKDKLVLNWTYRGEYLSSPNHNVLRYDRVPKNHIILFDIATGLETYAEPELVRDEATRLDLECVPTFGVSVSVSSPDTLLELLERTSILGGQKIEGFVAKNYKRFDIAGKPMFGKYVSEAFKESHAKEWGEKNPSQSGIIEQLIAKYKTDARWSKAVIHCKERGEINGEPRDIPALMKELDNDFDVEEKEGMRDILYRWAEDHVKRGLKSGLANWYKERLLKESFTNV